MKKSIKLTESDLVSLIKRVISEQTQPDLTECFKKNGIKPPASCIQSPAADKKMDVSRCLSELGSMVVNIGTEKVFAAVECIKKKTNRQY